MNASYTVAFSAGVASGGSGNFSSRACVITSESGIHFSSIFIKGTLPSGLMFKNLHIKHITKGPFKLRAQMYSKYFRKPRQTELSGNTASKVRSLPLGFVAQIHQLQFIRKVFLLQCKQNPLREGTCKHLLDHSWKIHTNTVWIISRSTPGNFNFKITTHHYHKCTYITPYSHITSDTKTGKVFFVISCSIPKTHWTEWGISFIKWFDLQSPSLFGVEIDSLAQTSSGSEAFEHIVRFLGRLQLPGADIRYARNLRGENCLMVAESAVADGAIFAVDISGLDFSFLYFLEIKRPDLRILKLSMYACVAWVCSQLNLRILNLGQNSVPILCCG